MSNTFSDSLNLRQNTARLVCGKNFISLNRIGQENDCYVRFNAKTNNVYISGKDEESVEAVKKAIIERQTSVTEKYENRPTTTFTPINHSVVPRMMGNGSSRLLSLAKQYPGCFIRFENGIFRVTARDEQTLANATQGLGKLQSDAITERDTIMKNSKYLQAAKNSERTRIIDVSVPNDTNPTRVILFVAVYDEEKDPDTPYVTQQIEDVDVSSPVCVKFIRTQPRTPPEEPLETPEESLETPTLEDDWSELTEKDPICRLDQAQVLQDD